MFIQYVHYIPQVYAWIICPIISYIAIFYIRHTMQAHVNIKQGHTNNILTSQINNIMAPVHQPWLIYIANLCFLELPNCVSNYTVKCALYSLLHMLTDYHFVI